MKDKLYINDSYMLKFLQQKLDISQAPMLPMEIKDDKPYLQYIYDHITELWYSLMVADLMQGSNKKVDVLIEKYQHIWFKKWYESVKWSKEHPKQHEVDSWFPKRIEYIGTYTLNTLVGLKWTNTNA